VSTQEQILDGVNNSTRHYIILQTDGTFLFEPNLVTSGAFLLDGISVSSSSNYPIDGKQHSIECTVSGSRTINSFGARDNTADGYTGILSDIEIERSSSLIHQWNLDEDFGVTSTAVDSVGSNDATAVNIVSGDSENFTFNGAVSPNTWTNDGATRVIEVAGT
jgi:hypothetical protein